MAPTNGNNVVVANGGQVFVSTNALAATVGADRRDVHQHRRNLPGRNVLRAAFDPNDPTVIYAVLGGFDGGGTPGHVFRTTIGAASLDGHLAAGSTCRSARSRSTAPTRRRTIYVGTDLGVLRSVDRGATWTSSTTCTSRGRP